MLYLFTKVYQVYGGGAYIHSTLAISIARFIVHQKSLGLKFAQLFTTLGKLYQNPSNKIYRRLCLYICISCGRK